MKRKFTLLIATVMMLMAMIVQPLRMAGQSDYSSDYTGNITLSTAGGTNASDCVIAISGTNYSGIKAGTSSKVGAVVVTVPSGTKYLHIHAAAWNGTTASLAVTPDGYSENIALTANSGIANNSPFTFNGNANTSDYYKVITFSDALTANTDLTFTAVGGKRFVIWGVTSEEDTSGDTPSITASNVQIAYDATEGDINYTINNPATGGGNVTFSLQDETWLQNVTVYADNNMVMFNCDPNPSASARTDVVTLIYQYGNAAVTKDVTVTQAGNPNVTMTIAEVREQSAGSTVATTGTVTSCSGSTGYIQDDEAAICVYGTSLTIGDEIRVSGTLSNYNGLLEITSPQVTVLSSGNVVLPQLMTIAEVVASANQGWYVRIENASVTEISGKNVTITENQSSIVVRFNSADDITFEANDIISLDGNIGYYNGNQIANPMNVEVQQPTTSSITISPDVIYEIPATGDTGYLQVTCVNMGDDPTLDIIFCDANGGQAQYDWISAEFNQDYSEIIGTVVANESNDPRTAYLKVIGYTETQVSVTSNIVSITQLGQQVPPTGNTYTLFDGTIAEGDYIIVFDGGAMNHTVANNRLQYDQVTVENNAIVTDNIDIVWHIAQNGDYWTIYNDAAQAYAAATGSKNQAQMLADGTDDKAQWTVTGNGTYEFENKARAAGSDPNNKWLRKNGTYGFACYANSTGGALSLYKKVEDPSAPSISVPSVSTFTYEAHSSVAIQIQVINYVEGGQLDASTEADWIENVTTSGGTDGYYNVNFDITENDAEARTDVITITYNYYDEVAGDYAMVSGNLTISQEGNPGAINNISDITATGDYTVQGTIVAKSNRGFIVGDGTGYVYYYNQNYTQADYNIGDIVKLAGAVVAYGGAYEFNSSAVITFETTSGYVEEDPTIISGADMDGRVSSSNPALSSYVQYEGKLAVSGNYYNITDIDGATTAKGSISYPIDTQFTSLDGKQVRVKGYYVGVSSSQYYNTMIGTVEEVSSSDPSITISPEAIHEVPAAGDTGYLEVTCENMGDDPTLDIIFCDANGGQAQYDWISAEFNQDYSEIIGTVVANESNDPRTAYLKVIGYTETQVSVTSNIVSITQLGQQVPPTGDTYTLFAGNIVEGDYIIVFDDGAMNHTVANNRLQYDEVSIENNAIVTDNIDIVWHIAQSGDYWTIYSDAAQAYAAATGSKNQAQMLADGTDDKAQWTVTGNGTYEFENKARATGSDPNNKWLRKNGTYGFACYATSTGDALSLYKKVEDPTAPSITVTPYTVEVNAEGGEGVLTITCTNMGDDPYLDFEFCDASGQSTQYDWISGTLKDNQINGFIQPNYGEERTAYLRVFGYSPTQEMIYSNIVSFTQLEYIAPSVAELPFDFDGGKADIEETEGLTQEGLDSDYSSSPKLKFKNTGTWVLLQFAEPASSVSYDIKGNSFSGGQFDVYISEDGNNYQNIASYTELGATQTVTHILHFMPVYYVKWVYTQKSSGNVALGNIHASANYDVYGEVTIEQINAADTHIIIHDGGLLNVTGGIGAANNDDVIIEDGGQLIFNQDMIPATVRRNITAASSWKDEVDGWYLIASPAETMETSPVAIGNYDLFAYDEETAYWWSDHGTNAGHPFSTLNRGQGYLYANAEDQVLDLAGMMHSMNESVYVDLSYACTYEDLKGFNLVGNPFTCNLGSGNMHMGNYPVTAYYASEGGTKLETYLIEEYPIKPGRGFMIQATEEYQSLSFHQASKDGDLGYRGYIRINAGNDNAYIQIGGGNTLRKMNIANTNEVYVMNDGKDFAAARVDELEGTMPVNFKAVADGTYTITVEARGIEVYNMYLVDNFTSEVIDLMLEPSYTFNATTDDNEARFTLVFDANSIEEVAENSIFAYQNGSEIIVNGNGELQVFDVTGRMVLNTTINGIQAVNMPQGVYVLRMVGDNIQTQKIVVR